MQNIDIIGACSDLGVHVDGAKLGPEILEKKLNQKNINKIINIKANNIKKELDKNNLKKNLNEINIFNQKLYTEVLNSLNNNYKINQRFLNILQKLLLLILRHFYFFAKNYHFLFYLLTY